MNDLEQAMTVFVEQTNLAIAEIRSSIVEIRSSNRRTDERLLELQRQADEDRKRADADRKRADEDRKRADQDRRQWEAEFGVFREQADADRKRTDQDRQRWEAEFRMFREQADADRKRADEDRKRADSEWKQERRDFNKRLAELSDSMGTLIEDMVAPCGFQLANAVFGTEEARTCGIRIEQKHPTIKGEMMELDLLAVGPTKVLVVEVKRKMDAARAAEYKRKLRCLPEFFPELAGKTVCAGVASVYLAPSVVKFLNRQKLYGIAMGDEVMEVVNLGQF